MDDQPISIYQALNHLQSWLNAGEYDKVIQGAQEILEMEPGNQRALALMKQAEEKRVQNPTPAAPDPLENLQVENEQTQTSAQPEPKIEPKIEEPKSYSAPLGSQSERRNLFLAMLVPALLVIVIGGGIIFQMSHDKNKDIVDANISTQGNNYIEENDERAEDLTQMALVIEAYKRETGFYPSAQQVEEVLLDSEEIRTLPTDPRHGEVDKDGDSFAYVYAVYENARHENSAYVLSALLEDSKGFGYAWFQGSDPKRYPDYRDVTEDNITFIGTSKETEQDTPKVKVKR